jgi:hypothetical protein
MAIIVKLGTPEAPVCFAYDTETARLAAVWSGDAPLVHGQRLSVTTEAGPAWAAGRLSSETAPTPITWKGADDSSKQTQLKFVVGKTEVLEIPGTEVHAKLRCFTRTILVGPTTEPLTLLLADGRTGSGEIRGARVDIGDVADTSPANGHLVVLSRMQTLSAAEVNAGNSSSQALSNAPDLDGKPKAELYIGLQGAPDGAKFEVNRRGRALLRIPASGKPQYFQVVLVNDQTGASNPEGPEEIRTQFENAIIEVFSSRPLPKLN